MAMVAYGKSTSRCGIVRKRPLGIESLLYPTPWFSDIRAVCRLSLNLMHASTAHLVVAAAAVVAGDRKTAAAANSALTHSLIATTVMLASASAAKLPQVLSFLPSTRAHAEERALSSSSCKRSGRSVGRSVCKFNEKYDVVRRGGENLYFVA